VSALTLFPAIDLKGGACVRLVQGDMARATVFSTDPAAQAARFAEAGFEWLHVVDLDGAFAGRAVNGAAVEAVLAASPLKVQLGGGIRDLAGIEGWLDRGVARVVLGTAALRDPALVADACRRFPGRIAVAIDARDGLVAVEGWAEQSAVPAGELARGFEGAGVAALIYTDIARDGVLAGLDAGAVAAFARTVTTPVIASGGIATLADLEALKAVADAGIVGAICGRALYDGRLEARAALALLAA
jgi:phosphoribosylformimino-5-aminoimidazole carboxamide ribotide isomerase